MEHHETPRTVSAFLARVGRKDLQVHTGYSVQLMTRAKSEGVFPTHWLWKIRDFCQENGFETPEHLFRGHPKAPNLVKTKDAV